MIGPVPRFQNVQFGTHEIVPATRPDGKAGASYERRTVWLSGQLSVQPRVLRQDLNFLPMPIIAAYAGVHLRSIEASQTKYAPMIDRADRQAGESAVEDTLSSKHH
jgi:hypothetical protein